MWVSATMPRLSWAISFLANYLIQAMHLVRVTYAVLSKSVKRASDLDMPSGGEIVAINDILEDTTVNHEAYGRGWMIKLKANDPAQLNALQPATITSGENRVCEAMM